MAAASRGCCRKGVRTDRDLQEELKTSLYDTQGHKRLVDDAVAAALLDAAPELEADMRYENAKLAAMVVACIAACVAQFAPLPFPASRPLLAVCVVVYFGLSAVLQYCTWFVDNSVVISCAAKAALPALAVRVVLEPASPLFAVVLEAPPGRRVASHTHGLGEFFTGKGQFAEETLVRVVGGELRAELERLRGRKER